MPHLVVNIYFEEVTVAPPVVRTAKTLSTLSFLLSGRFTPFGEMQSIINPAPKLASYVTSRILLNSGRNRQAL